MKTPKTTLTEKISTECLLQTSLFNNLYKEMLKDAHQTTLLTLKMANKYFSREKLNRLKFKIIKNSRKKMIFPPIQNNQDKARFFEIEKKRIRLLNRGSEFTNFQPPEGLDIKMVQIRLFHSEVSVKQYKILNKKL